MDTYYSYKAYVKDALHLNERPKAFLTVSAFDIQMDLMTTANSSLTVMEENVDNITHGDILCLYNPKGLVIYQGVIKSIDSSTSAEGVVTNKITTAQMQNFYAGDWFYETHHDAEGTNYIEDEIKYVLERFANGYCGTSTYQDTLMAQEKGILAVDVGTRTEGRMLTDDPNTTLDMESFIYELYDRYGMVFDFNIPYEWQQGDPNGGKVTISIPNYTKLVVGDNTNVIANMSPITETEETNKLVLFTNDGQYVTTYFATSTNGIVENPTTNAGRFQVINTFIVFSDDPKEVVRDSYLSTSMYNHKVTFDLILDNKLYDWHEWKLGQGISIWHGQDYYDSVYTGYRISKSTNQKPIKVTITCGKVRTALSKKLSMGVIRG